MSQNVTIAGASYTGVPSIDVPKTGGGSAKYVDTSDANAAAGEIVNGKTAYVGGAKVTGSMTDRGAVSGTISTKDGQYTVPAGYHNGSGKVQISSTEQAKVIAGNIRSGVTLLGVAGSSSVVNTSDANAAADKILSGYTAYVNGAKLTGSYSPPASGFKVQTGSFVNTDNTNRYLNVTGLPFKPVGAAVVKQSTGRKSGNLLCTANQSIYQDGSVNVYGIYQTTGTSTALVSDGVGLTLGDSGFSFTTRSSSYNVYGHYLYVAWGN